MTNRTYNKNEKNEYKSTNIIHMEQIANIERIDQIENKGQIEK